MTGGYLLAYDADCGPCSRFKAVVEFLDVRGLLEFVTLGQADRAGMLDGIESGARYRSFHLVERDGQVWSGAAALTPLSRLVLPGGVMLARVVEGVPSLRRAVEFGYLTLARLHGSGACGMGAR